LLQRSQQQPLQHWSPIPAFGLRRFKSITYMQQNPTIGMLLSGFVDYMAVERRFSSKTVEKYESNLNWFLKHLGDFPIGEIDIEHFIRLKSRLCQSGARESRTASVICALKALLRYANEVMRIPTVDLSRVKLPRPPRREVVYLTSEELEHFLNSIPLRRWTGEPRLSGYAFRALVEALAATGMRISEALSLRRDSIDLENRKARIVGKGNKERTVHFTPRALTWIDRYLQLRADDDPALFRSAHGNTMTANSVEAFFRRHAHYIGIQKHVTPHVIRHTTATKLLRNGCPIGFIKEILGHDRLETTCRFYLGIMSEADVGKAYRRYSDNDTAEGATKPGEVNRHEPNTPNSLTGDQEELNWKHPP
jgi:site-specific recombinase XerD